MTQKELDIEYAKSLGYNVNENPDLCEVDFQNQAEQERLEYESTHLFDYAEKTKQYLSELYY